MSSLRHRLSALRSKTNFLSAEYQDCFGHTLVEVLRAPSDENEVLAVVCGLRTLGDELKERGIVAAFSFAPNDSVELATAFIAAGYRKTGLLAQALMDADGGRKDAILWTRKLASPLGDDFE